MKLLVMARENSTDAETLRVEVREMVAPVLWAGYGLKMTHDLANSLTALSALKCSVERSAKEDGDEWAPKVIRALETVTESLAGRVRSFHQLRERFDALGTSLNGEEFVLKLRRMLEPMGWEVKETRPMAPSVYCHMGIFFTCVQALQDRLAVPRVATVSVLPGTLTGGRPMLAVHLGHSLTGWESGEGDEVPAAVRHLLRTMGGLLEAAPEGDGTRLRILLPQTQ